MITPLLRNLAFLAGLALALCAPVAFAADKAPAGKASATTAPASVDPAAFVQSRDGQFWLGGSVFRFAGTNNYYLHYESDRMQTDVLDAAVGMGFKVIRLWGFMNGETSQNRDHRVYGMTSPGVYGIPADKKAAGVKDAFERLDFTVAQAGKRGLKLIIALNNYWADFGGIQQAATWQTWFGLAKPTDFYTNPKARAAYKTWITWMLTRVNRYTGIPYNQDPTIMAWELMNEPRNPDDKTGTILTAWTREMSDHVKKTAPLQLCALGSEGSFVRTGEAAASFMDEGSHMYNGNEGLDSDAILGLPGIDFGTLHLYPEAWGISADAVQGWGIQFIKDHLAAGRKAGKPVILEEYGIGAHGDQHREAIYDSWNRTVLEEGGAASMVWLLTASNDKELADNPPGDGIYDDYDGFRIMNDQSPVSRLLSRYATLFAANSRTAPQEARAWLVSPAKARDVKGFYRIRAQYAGSQKVKEARLWLDGKAANLLQFNRQQDVWRYNLDTQPLADGSSLAVQAVFTLADGTVVKTDTVKLTIANKITYSPHHRLDFSSSTHGAESLGAYQADLHTITHSPLNGGMLAIQATLPGKNEWEELKIKFGAVPGIKDGAKIEFTLYYEDSKAQASTTASNPATKLPGSQPYLALEPGWVKTGIGEHNQTWDNLEKVVLEDGKTYRRHRVSQEFFQNPSYIGFTICPTLGLVAYKGTVYLDEVLIFKKD